VTVKAFGCTKISQLVCANSFELILKSSCLLSTCSKQLYLINL